jgi:hypothetical protein
MSKPVYIPLINPNEPEALLATLPVRLGQAGAAGRPALHAGDDQIHT